MTLSLASRTCFGLAALCSSILLIEVGAEWVFGKRPGYFETRTAVSIKGYTVVVVLT
jgi:hypothetical protein